MSKAEIETLKAENKRLRALLREVYNCETMNGGSHYIEVLISIRLWNRLREKVG